MKIRTGLVVFISAVQAILFLTHLFLYETWTFSTSAGDITGGPWLKIVLGILSVSFLAASLLAWRYTGPAVRAMYKVAAVWLGLLSFLVAAAVSSWFVLGVTRAAGLHANFHFIVEVLFSISVAAGVYGVFNAGWTRITRTTVRLANLPEAWRGRKAALISDVHLGHVRDGSFLRRIVTEVRREKPDAVFIAGDLYDGTAIDARRAAAPLSQLTPPHGVYFVAGNHEQFGDDTKYLNAVAATGVRVLQNENVNVNGLQVVGVPYRDSVADGGLASALQRVSIDRDRASILLVHAPDDPHAAEAHGFSLQLSGHTHLGQFIPWSWMARRIYRQFVYGLSRIGKMQVFTSSGVGTWGPPLRLGSNPEIVMLEFE